MARRGDRDLRTERSVEGMQTLEKVFLLTPEFFILARCIVESVLHRLLRFVGLMPLQAGARWYRLDCHIRSMRTGSSVSGWLTSTAFVVGHDGRRIWKLDAKDRRRRWRR